jgi:hypothetical protein
MFIAKYIFGKPEGADDIEAVKWFIIENLTTDDFVPEHHILYKMFMNKMGVEQPIN